MTFYGVVGIGKKILKSTSRKTDCDNCKFASYRSPRYWRSIVSQDTIHSINR